MCICVSMCPRGWKSLDPLELEFQGIRNCLKWCEQQNSGPVKEKYTLLTMERLSSP